MGLLLTIREQNQPGVMISLLRNWIQALGTSSGSSKLDPRGMKAWHGMVVSERMTKAMLSYLETPLGSFSDCGQATRGITIRAMAL